MSLRTTSHVQSICLALLVPIGGALLVGCPGFTPDGSVTVQGTVTNARTSAGVSGATVAVDPPPASGEAITTDENGRFSVTLSAGVHTFTVTDPRYEEAMRTVNLAAGQTTVDFALDPAAPVYLTTSMEGDAVPGGSVTLGVSVEVLDGETTVEGYSWSQSNSVDVQITGATTANPTVTLPAAAAYKTELLTVASEPPISEEDLPPNVPLPEEEEFPAGIQNRFYLVGLNPFTIEEAALVQISVDVQTSSGVYSESFDIHTQLDWKPTTSLTNVPVGIPILLQGKLQDAYDWALTAPDGSESELVDGTSRNPHFTPDLNGLYTVTVTDLTGEAPQPATLEIYAGTWLGAISGTTNDGTLLANDCTGCHNDRTAADKFTPWRQSGHAEIFQQNLDTSTHYGTDCLPCHTVGFDEDVRNGGFDDVEQYDDFVAADLFNNPGDNWATVVSDFPQVAKLAQIQCENCHGPQSSGAHQLAESRISFSADVCATCHGEPLRHGRFQQWQLSGHANFPLAIDESTSGSCSRCHTVNGFLKWLPVLLDDDPETDPLADVEVTWTADEAFPQTCVACHDPHNPGSVSGDETDVTVRIVGDTPPLIGGFTVFGAGQGAICMTCHNSRRGLKNDGNFGEIIGTGEVSRAPHGSSQTDVLMGQNAYFVDVGTRGAHSLVENTCVNCHMEQTPPPEQLSYNEGGTNHTFFARPDICARCHGDEFTSGGVQGAFQASADELQRLIEIGITQVMEQIFAAGNSIDVAGEATLTSTADFTDLVFGEAHGRQAVTFTLADGAVLEAHSVADISVLDGGGEVVGVLFDFADEEGVLVRAGWNWNLVTNDGSKGVHYPSFVTNVLSQTITRMKELTGQ
ncbi:MAG: hypothetical protein C4547_06745 [Phycisphaerales bacterium]|nr:MAG: hypothetical protein C4547_06745 [Phycisphaerales bacterium]